MPWLPSAARKNHGPTHVDCLLEQGSASPSSTFESCLLKTTIILRVELFGMIHLVVISPQLQAVHLRSDPLLPLSALNRSKQTENALNAIRISAPRDLTRIGLMIRNA